ncbi:related to cytochrome P450 CYP3/CYP5/CYP6/CYP9 subfamilies [Fusarium fujikuroi]|nr:related to cytochrome P450 CYP3/CYP5/CYP6/CYP9 subfamilies [Fusarium fujikuroi]
MSIFIVPVETARPLLVLAAAALIMFSIIYFLYLTIYRLFLSPISQFPGPKLAAWTYWYEFWYDVVAEPEYTFKIGRLHKQYGPIVRINPDEIHIADPDFYNTIYAGSGRKRDKWDWITRSFGVDESLIGTLGHDEHRIRRAALSPYFSKQSVRALQPLVDRNMGILLGRFREFAQSGAPLKLDDAYAALTNDIVEDYAFGKSENRLQAADFDPSFRDAMLQGGKAGHVLKHFPWLMDMLRKLPNSMLLKLSPAMGAYSQLQTSVKKQVADITQAHQMHAYDKTRRTIFHEILNSKLSDYDKSTDRLWQEGEVVVAAGTITTAWALGVSTYFVLATPDILSRLKDELEAAIPDPSQPLSLLVLERLPFLTGVVQEGVRLSHAISHRLHRICPDETLVYRADDREWRIPPGTPLSMTSNLVHHDERVFPDSHTFKPERWVNDPLLDRYLVAFGKGGRACLGINLAYAELYLTLAALFRVYGTEEVQGKDDVGTLKLFETTAADLVITSDTVVPVMPEDSKGLRVTVHQRPE